MRARFRLSHVALLLVLAAALAPLPVQGQGTMQAPTEINRRTRVVEEDLMCQCGCTMGLAVCDCGTAEEMRAEIAGMMDQGESTQEILDFYVGQYGEKVLSAPTRSGFNLTAWVTPFGALLAGGALLFWLVRRWAAAFRQSAQPVAVEGPSDELTSAERQALTEEIDDLLRRNF